MDEETIKTIEAKIAEIEKERNEFVSQVNKTLAYYNGKIAALKELLPGPPEGAGQEEESATEEPVEQPEKKEKSHD